MPDQPFQSPQAVDPGPTEIPTNWFSIVFWTLIHAAMISLIFVLLAWVTPEFKNMFEEFEIDLNGFTVKLIILSRFVSRFWLVFLGLLPLVLVANFLQIYFAGRFHPAMQRQVIICITALLSVVLILIALGIGIPLLTVITGLSD